MTDRRFVFLDIDGTILNHEQHLAPSVIEAVRGARAAGHVVYICTGRSRAEIPPSVLDIGVDGAVTAGGGFTERAGILVASNTMPAADAAWLASFFEDHGLAYTLQGYEDVYPSEGLRERLAPLFAQARGIDLADLTLSADVEVLASRLAYRGPAPTDGIAKATFFGDEPGTYQSVRDGVGDRYHVITGTIPYLGDAGGEVSLVGMNKGAAITQEMRMLGVPLDDVIAIGDSTNDLEMLAIAGVGIAMAGSSDEVVAAADEMTTGVDEDGVWNAFVKHGLVSRRL